MGFRAKVKLKRADETGARPIGEKNVKGRPIEGEHVSFEHGGRIEFGFHSIGPKDWEQQGVVPKIIVHLSPGELRRR
jgi:hypothetical protein